MSIYATCPNCGNNVFSSVGNHLEPEQKLKGTEEVKCENCNNIYIVKDLTRKEEKFNEMS